MASAAQISEDFRETVLPLAMVRAHCKIDDVPSVTDDQVRLYRETAFETVALYTKFGASNADEFVTEAVAYPQNGIGRYHLKHPAIDGIVTVTMAGVSVNVIIPPGGQYVEAGPQMHAADGKPVYTQSGYLSPALRYRDRTQQDMTIRYRAGNVSATVPAGLRVGMLQMIAYLVDNPGSSVDGQMAAISSGAMKSFMRYRTNIGF